MMEVIARWTLEDFWIAIALLVFSLGFRHFYLRNIELSGTQSRESTLRILRSTLNTTTLVPVLAWCLLANRIGRLVMETHAWSQPKMLLAASQEMVGGFLLLIAMLAADTLSRKIIGRRLEMAELLNVSPLVGVAVGSVVLDWFLSEIAWWSLISGTFAQ